MKTLKLHKTHRCVMDGKGRLVIVETRKTAAAARKMEERTFAAGHALGIIVREWVGDCCPDGVCFADANGEAIDSSAIVNV